MNSFLGLLCGLGLVCGNVAECHEDCTIDGPGVEQEAPNHLLNVLLSIFIQFGAVICWCCVLTLLAILDGIRGEWTMLRMFWFCMPVLCELFLDVGWHGEINMALLIVLIEGDADIEASSPISLNGVLVAKCCKKVVCIFFSNILYSKIIYNKGEPNGACVMRPKAWRVLELMLAMGSKALTQ